MTVPRPIGSRALHGVVFALLAVLSTVPFELAASPCPGEKAPETLYHIQIVTDLHSLPSEYWFSELASDTNPLIQELLPLNSTRRSRLRTALDRLPPVLRGSISKLSVAVYDGAGVIFRRLQRTAFVAWDGYPDYAGPQWETRYTSLGAAISDGFVSPYASEEPREDLAEIVATFVDSGFASHGYCSQFEGQDGRVEKQQALAFAKLNFVRALGLIEDSQYRQCVRSADPAQNVITFQRTDTSNPTELMAYTRISGDGYVLITDFSATRSRGTPSTCPSTRSPRSTHLPPTGWTSFGFSGSGRSRAQT